MKSPLNPNYLYGTAWKEDLTEECVLNALKVGYRAVDTANQRKHYYEEGVGRALARAYGELELQRSDIFIQTKFTYARGQDHRKPYDENAPFAQQVLQSFESSLEHLKTDYLDSYILHGPSQSHGLTDADWEVWKAMESLHQQGKVRFLGVSNVSKNQLAHLYSKVTVKPSFVQNRCYATTQWDKDIRDFCLENNIHYQAFSLLSANVQFLGGEVQRPEGRNVAQIVFSERSTEDLPRVMRQLVAETGKDVQQIVFSFAQQSGMIPLTGTRSVSHMKANLSFGDFKLSAGQLEQIENIATL